MLNLFIIGIFSDDVMHDPNLLVVSDVVQNQMKGQTDLIRILLERELTYDELQFCSLSMKRWYDMVEEETRKLDERYGFANGTEE